MSNQPDEPQGEHLPCELTTGCYCNTHKQRISECVSTLKSQLAAATAVHHEQAESLLILADKNMKLAGERDQLTRLIDCGLVGERDGCLSDERVCLLCQLADLRRAKTEVERRAYDLDNALEVAKMLAEDFEAEEKRLRAQVEQLTDNPELDATDGAAPAWWRAHDYTAAVFCQHVNVILDGKDNGSGANTEPWGSTRKRLLGLVGELSAIDAALARRPVFDDLKTRAEKVWRACDTAAGLDRQLADARGYEIRFKALEPKLKDCEAALNQYRLSAELQQKVREADACTECKGTGEIGYVNQTELGPEGDSSECDACFGSGSQAMANKIGEFVAMEYGWLSELCERVAVISEIGRGEFESEGEYLERVIGETTADNVALCRQRHAAAEAVKRHAAEIASYGNGLEDAGSYIAAEIEAIDVAALVGAAQENADEKTSDV